jgi:pimeloyl-ACP methyl ester carboxylesterase
VAQRPHLYRHGRPPAYAGACFAGHDDEARGTSGNDSVVSRQTLGQTTEVALYHDVVGEGQSVCLINGYRLSGAAWPRAFISRLSMWCSVISFDNRGTGRSDKPDDGYDFGNQARYVIGLLDDLGLPRGAATLVATGTHDVLVKSRN